VVQVLIADDDEGIRESLRMLLEDEGHSVTEASNGQETLAYLRRESARCVALLDLVMPDMEGIELLESIQRDAALMRRHAFIVLSAGSEALMSQAQPLVAAMNGVIVRKPFDIDEVTRVVSEAAQRLSAG
jgi:CheY-like chemotaxis protein